MEIYCRDVYMRLWYSSLNLVTSQIWECESCRISNRIQCSRSYISREVNINMRSSSFNLGTSETCVIEMQVAHIHDFFMHLRYCSLNLITSETFEANDYCLTCDLVKRTRSDIGTFRSHYVHFVRGNARTQSFYHSKTQSYLLVRMLGMREWAIPRFCMCKLTDLELN